MKSFNGAAILRSVHHFPQQQKNRHIHVIVIAHRRKQTHYRVYFDRENSTSTSTYQFNENCNALAGMCHFWREIIRGSHQ